MDVWTNVLQTYTYKKITFVAIGFCTVSLLPAKICCMSLIVENFVMMLTSETCIAPSNPHMYA